METHRLAGVLFFRSRTYSAIHLSKPKEELEFRVHRRPGINIVFNYLLRESNDQRTQIKQTVSVVRLPKLLENLVMNQANWAQRPSFKFESPARKEVN